MKNTGIVNLIERQEALGAARLWALIGIIDDRGWHETKVINAVDALAHRCYELGREAARDDADLARMALALV